MKVIDLFTTKEQFLSFRDHVDHVMRQKNMGIPLKKRKIDELASLLAGAPDFNTALGMIAIRNPVVDMNGDQFKPGRIPLDDTLAEEPPTAAPHIEIAVSIRYPGHHWYTFDAADYFIRCVANRSILGVLADLRNPEMAPKIAQSIVRFIRKDNEHLDELLDWGKKEQLWPIHHIDLEHVTSWLINHGHFLLVSWFEMLERDDEGHHYVDFEKCNDEAPEKIYFVGSEDEIAAFHKVAPPAFKVESKFIKGERIFNKGHAAYSWEYPGLICTGTFESQHKAITNFLETLACSAPDGPFAVDLRLSSFIVADEGEWGLGNSLNEAIKARPHSGNQKLSKSALVYRCTADSRINDEGAITHPMEDPAPVRIDPKTLDRII